MSRPPSTATPPAPALRLTLPDGYDDAAAAPPGARIPSRPTLRHRLRALRARARRGVTVEGTPLLGRDIVLEVARGAHLVLGDGCVLLAGCRLHARGGELRVGAGAVLGERCAVVAHAEVELGAGCRLGDGVVACDIAPVHTDVERPVRQQGMRTAPVRVGARARIGPGVVLEAGARVRPDGVVGAHRVVAGR